MLFINHLGFYVFLLSFVFYRVSLFLFSILIIYSVVFSRNRLFLSCFHLVYITPSLLLSVARNFFLLFLSCSFNLLYCFFVFTLLIWFSLLLISLTICILITRSPLCVLIRESLFSILIAYYRRFVFMTLSFLFSCFHFQQFTPVHVPSVTSSPALLFSPFSVSSWLGRFSSFPPFLLGWLSLHPFDTFPPSLSILARSPSGKSLPLGST